MKKILFVIFISIQYVSFGQKINQFDTRNSEKKPFKTPLKNSLTINGYYDVNNTFTNSFPIDKIIEKKYPQLKITWGQHHLPIMIEPIKPIKIESKNENLNTKDKTLDGIFEILDQYKDLLRLNAPSKELKMIFKKTDDLGYIHYKFQQQFCSKNDILNQKNVYGGEIWVHIKNNEITAINGTWFASPEVLNFDNHILAESQAQTIALKLFTNYDTNPNPFLKQWRSKIQKPELILYVNNSKTNMAQLAYILEVRPNTLAWHEIIINAISGEIIRNINKTCDIDGPKTTTGTDLNNNSRSINTYQVGSTYYMIDASRLMFNSSNSTMPNNPDGVVWTLDANFTSGTSLFHVSNTSNTFSQKAAVSAHYNAGLAYEYYKNIHGRNSINGSGGNIISIINVTEDDGGGLDNAYWNGEMMFYGNGSSVFKPLAGSLDVGGHEMTHGVVQNTANLEYQGQSGAINESMADVFGSLLDRSDWKIGEDITKTSYIPTGCLRDMSDPHNGGNSLSDAGYQPKNMSEYYTGTQDNGGVHINSGIPNYAFYLIASNIGQDKAEDIYYRALDLYLTKQSQFINLRAAIIKAAQDIHGTSASEVTVIANAFNQVGIYGEGGNGGTGGGSTGGGGTGGGQNDLPKNTGTEMILSVDTDLGNSGTIYTSTTVGSNFVSKSTTDVNRKPSVTDDGTKAYFVSKTDNRVKSINVQTSSNETSVTALGDAFDNVAISRDGKRMACITTDIDTSIYVYDFGIAKWTRFKLYNPTYTSGINTRGVLYADGIEFDYSGQNIIYDAKNIIESAFGDDISYWDIATINVWNNAANNWGSGKIEKLFNQLPSGISIGNPTYSKNSPYIIAFDLIDTDLDEYYIYGKNIATGTSKEIVSNIMLGFPNYSNADDKIIYDAKNTSGIEVLASIGISSDKITGSGTASILISDAKWGVWLANGTRKLLSDKKDILAFGLPSITPSPVSQISSNAVNLIVDNSNNVSSLTASFVLSPNATAKVNGMGQISEVSRHDFRNPINYTITAEDGTTKNYVVTVNLVSGIHQVQEDNNIKLIPNPNNGHFEILGIENPNWEVIDAKGQTIKSGSGKQVDLDTIAKGVYHITLNNQKTIFHQVLIIK